MPATVVERPIHGKMSTQRSCCDPR